MSTPRCLRIAIHEARRPTLALRVPSSSLSSPSPCRAAHHQAVVGSQSRHSRSTVRAFSSCPPRCVPQEDITAGFPMPELGSRKIQPSGEEKDAEAGKTPKPEAQPRPSKQSAAERGAPPAAEAVQRIEERIPSRSETAAASKTSESQPLRQRITEILSSSTSASESSPSDPSSSEPASPPPVPPNVLAAYRTPMRHPLTHGVPVASLQLRSYSARNLEFYADFCVRAAYYLGLPCTGPGPLPRKRERWTVLKSNFINKKAQENFERITLKRLITVYDGEPSVVEVWLAFLRKWQFYGVGMKANVWQWEELDVAGKMDREFKSLEKELDDKLSLFGFNKTAADKTDLVRVMEKQKHRQVGVGMSELREKSRTTEDPF